ncbi:MAG TPA: hypothetical protein VJ863_05530, partial [Sphaerochaeta sp.]|nr:hypothetical protein [Sphaerochaeta sp.]
SSIRNPEYLYIHDTGDSFVYGADQEWYPMLWQRRAGCGPTTASNLMLYFQQKNKPRLLEKEEAILMMQEVWKLVTPGIMGVHLLSQFTKGVEIFLPKLPFALTEQTLKIPRAKEKRPSLASVVAFLIAAFENDSPVAFLNLSKGTLSNLDEWHWVTLVGIEQAGEDKPVYATLYDASLTWKIDLGLWLETTTRGGGFVWYQSPAPGEV